jgi:hypothetical protein
VWFRIPIRLTKTPGATNKAVIDYMLVHHPRSPEPSYSPAPGATVIEFEADTIAAARLKLQEIVRPHDPRPIGGRTLIGRFRHQHPPSVPGECRI